MKVISFDFDGTIAKHTFADAFWLEGVPTLYSQRHQVDFETAKHILFEEYKKIGDNRIEWYDPGYWFHRFDLQTDWKKMLLDYVTHVEIYPEVLSVLKDLSTDHHLIISSNAKKEFIDVQLTEARLDGYFSNIFSSTSDFHTVKKVTDFYAMICKELHITPKEMIHVGDHKEFDFLCPQKLGITAYYLDREKNTIGDHVISDLYQFKKQIQVNFQKNPLKQMRHK